MEKQLLHINNIPAVIWGASSDKIYLYVHGNPAAKKKPLPLQNSPVPKAGRC